MAKIKIANKNNPVLQAFSRTDALMDRDSLHIEIDSYNTIVYLNTKPEAKYKLVTADGGEQITEFPCFEEFILIRIEE